MEKSDHLYGEWVLLGIQQQRGEQPNAVDEPLLAAARQAWPHVLAHARRKLGEKGLLSDSTVFAAEVWEKVLRAIAKKRQRRPEQHVVADLESYLIGIFHHRFNRLLEREQRRLSTIELVASTADLEKIESARNIRWVSELERAITIKQIVVHMDEWTRNGNYNQTNRCSHGRVDQKCLESTPIWLLVEGDLKASRSKCATGNNEV